jgi:hypothetical protein
MGQSRFLSGSGATTSGSVGGTFLGSNEFHGGGRANIEIDRYGLPGSARIRRRWCSFIGLDRRGQSWVGRPLFMDGDASTTGSTGGAFLDRPGLRLGGDAATSGQSEGSPFGVGGCGQQRQYWGEFWLVLGSFRSTSTFPLVPSVMVIP